MTDLEFVSAFEDVIGDLNIKMDLGGVIQGRFFKVFKIFFSGSMNECMFIHVLEC